MKNFLFYGLAFVIGYGIHLLIEAFVVSNVLAALGINLVIG